MKKFAGPKFGSSHTTVIDSAESLIKALEKSELVSKIILGVITNKAGSGQGGHSRYKVLQNGAGIKLTVSGSASIQNFYVYTADMPGVEALIARAWPGNGKKGKKKKR